MLYDGDKLSAEDDASGNLLRRYVHADGSDTPLVWYEGTGLGTRQYLYADHQGSITARTDASGAVVAVNTYDEYGIPGAGNSGRFQYTGQAWLPELAMYHYKARIYSPTLGRFLQTDPIGYEDQVNLYAYVGNDPVNGRDPTGRQAAIPLPLPPPPFPDTAGDNIFTQSQADLAQRLTETVTQAREAYRDRNVEAALNLDTNALIAVIEQPGTPQATAVEAAIANKKVFVSSRAVDEFMTKGSGLQLGVFLIKNNAYLLPNAPNTMVDQLVERGLSRNDAEIVASGLYAGNAPTLTRDQRILTRVPESSRRY